MVFFSISAGSLRSVWRWLTEPAASIVDLDARHRARTVASTLVLTIVLVLIPLIQRLALGIIPPTMTLILVIALIAYVFSRTRYYAFGGTIAVVALWLLPTYGIAIGYSNSPSFILTAVRLMLLALLFTYVMFSLRMSIVLAVLIFIGFLLVPTSPLLSDGPMQLGTDFLLTAAAVFFVFVITRQYDITERQHAQAEQRASEERYRAIVEVQVELVSRWLPDTTLTFVNEAYCRFFSKTREELIGTSFGDSLLPEDLALTLAETAKITVENPSISYEQRTIHPSGVAYWHQWTDHAIFDEHGKIIEYQSVGRDISERKSAEQALTASEERYRAIVELQSEMICRWVPDRTITFVNAACCRYFGKTREAMIGSEGLSFTHPDDKARVNRAIAMISREQPIVTYECRVFNAAGEIRWHQWSDQGIFDSEGKIVEYQSAGHDITELKHAEEAEREQRQFSEALAGTAALISSTLNLDEVLDRILNQVAQLNPLDSAEIILIDGDSAYIARSRGDVEPNTVFPEIRFKLAETRNLREMIETGRPLIISDVKAYEGWFTVETAAWIRAAVGAPILLEGETIGFLSMASVTPEIFTSQNAERLQAFADQAAIAIRNARMYHEVRHYAGELEGLVKERTAELELERQRLHAILDGTGEGIFYTERETIAYVNPAFCKLTGYTQTELVGQDYKLLYTPEVGNGGTDKLDLVRDGVQRSSVWRGEIRVRRKDGTQFDGGLTIATISAVSPLTAVTVVRDISRQKAVEAQRSTLVAYASHELRTPITNLKTRLYLLRRRPEFLEDHLLILDEVTERMRHLVEDLLDISRLEHGIIPMRRADVILQEMINAVISLQQPEAEFKNLELGTRLPDDAIYVFADRERLLQVVTNLVTNALNYTPSGGSVIVAVREQDGSALIEVEDTGIGIAPENLPHIFQPFYRVVSEVEGTGLGLSIAKEIIELHGGTLDVRSERHHGSVFTISLPLFKPMQVS